MARWADGHGHGHPNAGATHRWRLRVAFALVAAFFVVELVVGAWPAARSSLLSDAGHMAADVVALGRRPRRHPHRRRAPTRPGRRTFGSYRAEVFASGLAVLLMLGVAAYIVVAAVGRIGDEPEVASTLMLVVGVLGLVVNVVALALLRGRRGREPQRQGRLPRGRRRHGRLGRGHRRRPARRRHRLRRPGTPAIALAIAVFVAVRAVLLGREVLAVLGQHAPAGIVPADAEAALRGVGAVVDVHDLHLWTLTSGMHVATVHLVCDDDADPTRVLTEAAAVLRERFAIEHATIQVEPRSARACVETSW